MFERMAERQVGVEELSETEVLLVKASALERVIAALAEALPMAIVVDTFEKVSSGGKPTRGSLADEINALGKLSTGLLREVTAQSEKAVEEHRKTCPDCSGQTQRRPLGFQAKMND